MQFQIIKFFNVRWDSDYILWENKRFEELLDTVLKKRYLKFDETSLRKQTFEVLLETVFKGNFF